MSVTANGYNQTLRKILAKEITWSNLYCMLLTSAGTFTASHTTIDQIMVGTKSVVTLTLAAPGKVNWTGHGKANNSLVLLTTTGALPTGLSPGWYYVRNAGTNDFELSATSGGTSIDFTVSQSGVHTAFADGGRQVFGNGWSAGGESCANATIATVETNKGDVDIDDTSKTASGGQIGYADNAVIYDKTDGSALLHYAFGESWRAGDTTPFKINIDPAGLLKVSYA